MQVKLKENDKCAAQHFPNTVILNMQGPTSNILKMLDKINSYFIKGSVYPEHLRKLDFEIAVYPKDTKSDQNYQIFSKFVIHQNHRCRHEVMPQYGHTNFQ